MATIGLLATSTLWATAVSCRPESRRPATTQAAPGLRNAASAPATAPAEAATTQATPGIDVLGVVPLTQADFPAGLVRIEYNSRLDGENDWALALPPDEGRTWVVCIHGHGSAGDQLYKRPDVRQAWLPTFQKEHFGILTPNLRGNAWMSPKAAADLNALLQHIRTEYQADRFVLASGSMGGTSNLIYAVLHPKDVAAVVALCPATDLTSYYQWCRQRPQAPVLQQIAGAIRSAYGGPPDERPELYRTHSALTQARRLTMPVYIAHGAQDTVIPVGQSRMLANTFNAAMLHYREIPEGDHETPIQNMPDGIEWVLKRMR
jgi:pimeloyl-ACP methyl ester carboxylesterase